MDIGEMDLIWIECVKSPFRYFIIYDREIVYKRKKKDVTVRDGISLGCCGIYVDFQM